LFVGYLFSSGGRALRVLVPRLQNRIRAWRVEDIEDEDFIGGLWLRRLLGGVVPGIIPSAAPAALGLSGQVWASLLFLDQIFDRYFLIIGWCVAPVLCHPRPFIPCFGRRPPSFHRSFGPIQFAHSTHTLPTFDRRVFTLPLATYGLKNGIRPEIMEHLPGFCKKFMPDEDPIKAHPLFALSRS